MVKRQTLKCLTSANNSKTKHTAIPKNFRNINNNFERRDYIPGYKLLLSSCQTTTILYMSLKMCFSVCTY